MDNDPNRDKLGITGAKPEPDKGTIVVERPRNDEIPSLCMMGSMTIPGIAGVDIVRRVVARNRDSLWGIYRVSDGKRQVRAPLGFYANLLLSEEGLKAVKSGELNVSSPADEHMVPSGERPVAIYSWAVMAPGLLEKTLPLLAVQMTALYANLPILTAAATAAGKKTVNRRGFATDDKGLSTYEQSSDIKRSLRRGSA